MEYKQNKTLGYPAWAEDINCNIWNGMLSFCYKGNEYFDFDYVGHECS